MAFIDDDFSDVKGILNSGTFEITDEGPHDVRIVEILHVGKQPIPAIYGGGEEDKFVVVFEVTDDLVTKGEFAGKPKTIKKFMNGKISKKSNFRYIMEAVERHSLEDEEAKDYGLFNLLDKGLTLNVYHDNKKSKTGEPIKEAKITQAGYSALHKSVKLPDRVYDLRKLYLPKFNVEVFNSLPEWIRKIVNMNDVPEVLRPVSEL